MENVGITQERLDEMLHQTGHPLKDKVVVIDADDSFNKGIESLFSVDLDQLIESRKGEGENERHQYI